MSPGNAKFCVFHNRVKYRSHAINFNTAHKTIEQFVQISTTKFQPSKFPHRTCSSKFTEYSPYFTFSLSSSSVRVKSLARNFEESSLDCSAPENIGAREFREGLGEKKGTPSRLLAEGFTPGRFYPNKDIVGSEMQSLACWKDTHLELKVFPALG